MTTAAKFEEKPIQKQNKKKKKLSFADDHGQPLFTGKLYRYILSHFHSQKFDFGSWITIYFFRKNNP